MATRARILADYVSSGDELALKAPLASPVLVTPNLGTPSAGVVTNLSGVLPVGVTGGSGLTHLASNPTVTLGSNTTFPDGHVIKSTQYTSTTGATSESGEYVTFFTQSYTGTAGNLLLIISETNGSLRASAELWLRALYDGTTCIGSTYLKEGPNVNQHGTANAPACSMSGVVVCGSGAKDITIQGDNTSSAAVTLGSNNRVTVIEIQQD